MEVNDDLFIPFTQPVVSDQELDIFTQLSQYIAEVHHIDELFLWLSTMLSQHLEIPAVTFWAKQANNVGAFALDVRALARCHDPLPEKLIVNERIISLVYTIQKEHRGFWLKPVGSLFSHYQANVFTRYGLHYCSGYVLRSKALLPPARDDLVPGKVATPLLLVALLFLRQAPSRCQLLSIGHILARAMIIAKNYGLLLSAGNSKGSVPSTPAVSYPRSLSLLMLVPRRMQTANSQRLFADLPDRQVKRFYAVIDGHKNVSELAYITQLDINKASAALLILLERRLILLCAPDGYPVDAAPFLSEDAF